MPAAKRASRIVDPADVVITSAEAAAMIMVTPEWLRQLVARGWIKKSGKNRFRTIDLVQGHINYLKDEGRRAQRSASMGRVNDARARQIELAVAREQLEVIEVAEVQAFFSETMGALRSGLSGVATASTHDLTLRIAIEKNLNAAIERCKATFDAASQAMAARKPIHSVADETDA